VTLSKLEVLVAVVALEFGAMLLWGIAWLR